eukprot:TRINITY_DN6956_c0_g1_i1.p1 TRINITY_DN6956_c0_g1~~TRINITY_DN6956_c0_g1_i1.p1  ORF type:complete len:375 (+),score=125.85 TRINITY_DN6956_c0_g1_i1:84-1208(+)
MSETVPNGKRVVIVGGGATGILLAKSLDKSLDVTVVEKNDKFIHGIAAVRAAVAPSYAPKIYIPYDNTLKKGKVISGTVTNVAEGQVTVEGMEAPLPYDYLVLSSGCKWPKFLRGQNSAVGIEIQKLSTANASEATNILIIGGGAVGVELACEIRFLYADKKITLVHNKEKLLSPTNFKPKFYSKLAEKLERMKIEVITGDSVIPQEEGIPEDGFDREVKPRTFQTKGGKTIQADLSFWCIGGTPNTSYMRENFASSLTETGHLKTQLTTQLEGHNNIFVIGDINNFDEQKLAYIGEMHSKVCAENILTLSRGGNKMKQHKLNSSVVVLSMGPQDGVSQLPFGVVGGILTKTIKSKELFVGKWWGNLNAKQPRQ